MRTCTKCGEEKDDQGFYAVNGGSGRMGKCKVCWCARVRERRRTNPSVQAYDRVRAKLPHRRQHAREVTLRWREKNPDAYRAQTTVGNALRDGKLQKPRRCEADGCERRDLHAHHEDYSKPLSVRWLCPLHHHREHADHRGCPA